MTKHQPVGQPIEDHYYSITNTSLQYWPDGLLLCRFGQATMSLDENTAESHWVFDTFSEIKQKYPEVPFHILVDLSKVDDAEYNSDESNAMYKTMLTDDHVKKVAAFGFSPGWALFLELFRFYSKKLRMFSTEEQGMSWLTGGKNANTHR